MHTKPPRSQSGFSKKTIVLDGHQHLVGRLAAIVAKKLLEGEKVVVTRCEDLNFSGTFFRNRLKYLHFLHKRCNVNPKRGPFHHRAPSKIFQRSVRGMLPIKTRRGKDAYRRLKTFEGVPKVYMDVKRKIVPEALRIMRLRAGRKYCVLGRLSHLVGWKYQDVVSMLEKKRKVAGAIKYKGRCVKSVERNAEKEAAIARIGSYKKINDSLAKYGY